MDRFWGNSVQKIIGENWKAKACIIFKQDRCDYNWMRINIVCTSI